MKGSKTNSGSGLDRKLSMSDASSVLTLPCSEALSAGTKKAFLKNKRVLVTGATGFLGSVLAAKLQALEAIVVAVDRAPIPPKKLRAHSLEWHQGDCSHADFMSRIVSGCEVVFSLSGRCGHWDSVLDPMGDIAANTLAPLTVLEACKKWAPSAHVIYAGTRQVYGRCTALPVKEDHPVAPLDPNGIHKMTSELHHLLYYKQHNIRTTVLRLTNTYGPTMRLAQPGNSFLGEWIQRLLCGQDLVVYGDGSQLRDLNYAEDAVDAFVRVASCPNIAAGEVFNLGGGAARSLFEIASLLIETSKTGSRVRMEPYPSGLQSIAIGSYTADITKIRNNLGWTPQISLDEGLSMTWDALSALRHGTSQRPTG